MEKINPYEYFLYIDQCQKYWYMNELSVGNITSGLKNNMKQSSLIPSFYFLLWFSIVRDFFFPFLQRLFVILSGMSLLKSCFLWGIHPWIYCSLSANKAFKSCFNDSKKMIWTMITNFFSLLILIFSTSSSPNQLAKYSEHEKCTQALSYMYVWYA